MLIIGNDVGRRHSDHGRLHPGAGGGVQETADGRRDPPSAHRHVFPLRAGGRLLPLGLHGRRQRRLFRHPHEVGHHHLAENAGRRLDRGQALPRARHLLRRDLSRLDPERRAARLHQRRRAAAHARRRRRRHRHQVSVARGFACRRHAGLGRHGAHLPRSLRLRARHQAMQGVQPDGQEPGGLCRGDGEAPWHRGAGGRQPARGATRRRHRLVGHRQHEARL